MLSSPQIGLAQPEGEPNRRHWRVAMLPWPQTGLERCRNAIGSRRLRSRNAVLAAEWFSTFGLERFNSWLSCRNAAFAAEWFSTCLVFVSGVVTHYVAMLP